MAEKEKIILYLNKSKFELFKLLGQEIIADSLISPSDSELEDLGRNWFKRYIVLLIDQLCSSAKIRQLSEKAKKEQDTVALSLGILDLISGIVIGVSPILLTALIVKIGYDKICIDN